ncbi:MAG: hypothetical protein Tsb0010_03430 [Parvularculaceae bacterium]
MALADGYRSRGGAIGELLDRRRGFLACLSGVAIAGFALSFLSPLSSDAPDARPLAQDPWIWDVAGPAPDTVFLAEMTSGEIAAAMRSGVDTVILPAGGLEQNGPHVVAGKHDLIMRRMAEAIARELGDALVAPVISFVPQGGFDPPTGWVGYPGAVALRPDTYRRMIVDIAESLAISGFAHVILIGDSAGDQRGMARAARELNRRWRGRGAHAHFIAGYYMDEAAGRLLLEEFGIAPEAQGHIHTDLVSESILAALDPKWIRAERRMAGGGLEARGVAFEDARAAAAIRAARAEAAQGG